jgi:small subunit ribosomal protein S8
MSLSDPIGDMLARIKIASVLKEEGFIIDYKVEENQKKQNLIIMLKYNFGNPVINTIERVSKPGRRIFSSAESLPKINNGLGIAIISTPKGVMTDVNARKQKIGGEIICKVF